MPSGPVRGVPNLNNFRVATWSTVTSNPTARQYQRVAQRRMNAQRDPVDSLRRAMSAVSVAEDQPQAQAQSHSQSQESLETPSRPLEDPYLVGEVAAARARQERIAREHGDDILVREDRQWDWFLGK